ncbi:APC amino acid permease [Macrolepiota fuliginosa MF-IS2]|uniref:APC amino acid permease n=1 Tax=Macrolepiota fuliginosa MF-IS2 TaxID=1400762 RepID=A0A9P5XAB2_9AGAR|nr:APC amino acid permease [Macrolepiota fuliginosa MF-IS2]
MGTADRNTQGTESDPLLGVTTGGVVGQSRLQDGEDFDNVPRQKRQLGVISTGFLIFNRVIGTGIYATPSNILRSAGSVGVALIMWLVGSLIAAMGTTVYIELGTGLPRSGGEKNYLEFIYRRPKFLATCAFGVYAMITGTATANSVVFSEYLLHAAAIQPTWLNTRLVAFSCLTFICLIHGTALKWGLRLQNTLGTFKLVILSLIACSGILSLIGVPGFQVRDDYEKPQNYEWDKFWEGSGTGANAFVAGLYAIIWSFIGYSNANYALSEIRDPVRTIKRAAPIAMFGVSTVYMLINVAYFAVVSKDDILNSRRIVAALYFRNLYGPTTERALSGFIALSTLGNLLAGQFAQGRVIQELGREGTLPYSSFFASNKPFNAPLPGLFLQYTISTTFLLATPPGDAYIFLISLSSYCSTIINALVALGLLLLHTRAYQAAWKWDPPFRTPKIVVILFFLSNIFLIVVPFMPPAQGSKTYERLPYWSHSITAFAVSIIGVTYWYIWGTWLPRKRGYTLRRVEALQEDGVSHWIFQKDPIAPS